MLAAALALPQTASARIVELGGTADPASLNCPGTTEAPCVAAVRMTGYQGRASGGRSVLHPAGRPSGGVHGAARKPTAEEIDFFNDNFDTPSIARISVLRRGDTRKTRLQHRLITQSDRFELDPYFLEAHVRVRRADSGRRATGSPSRCPPGRRCRHEPRPFELVAFVKAQGQLRAAQSLRQFALQDLREVAEFGCTYHGARLLYSVTYVPSNRVTNEPAG